MKRIIVGLALALGLVASSAAQTVANGPYYAVPSWDQTLPAAQRFIVLSNMNSEAVLDRETGLVWPRTPSSTAGFRSTAISACLGARTGARQGWRLPRADELLTLADPSNELPDQAHLPAGHPFNVGLNVYWAADHIPADLSDGGVLVFSHGVQGGAISHTGFSLVPVSGAFAVALATERTPASHEGGRHSADLDGRRVCARC